MSQSREFNFDGIVGPTHNYSGLSYGNRASTEHRAQDSNPREAALQGLEKMRYLHSLGVAQAVLPPHERPDLAILRRLGFLGNEARVLEAAARFPVLLAGCSSASAMWTANAATIAPSADTADGKVHFTSANLVNKFHRFLESGFTHRCLKTIFADPARFVHHEPLPAHETFGDEGAANHTRLCGDYGEPGVHLFVYGREYRSPQAPAPRKFPARQTLEASEAVARLHGLREEAVVFAQQNPLAIDQGVFHNDVICVGNGGVLLFHEAAFLEPERVVKSLSDAYAKLGGGTLELIRVRESEVSLDEAVRSYLFNSQIVSIYHGGMALIAPSECYKLPGVRGYLDRLTKTSESIGAVHYLDVRQSMHNGGGPACLRLRVVLNEDERKGALPGVFFDETLYEKLTEWIQRHYRDRLSLDDLRDPRLITEVREALEGLTRILGLGALYDFQR